MTGKWALWVLVIRLGQHEMCRPQVSSVIEIQRAVFKMMLVDRHTDWRFLHEAHKINGFKRHIPHPLISSLMFLFNTAAQFFCVIVRQNCKIQQQIFLPPVSQPTSCGLDSWGISVHTSLGAHPALSQKMKLTTPPPSGAGVLNEHYTSHTSSLNGA